MKLNFKCLFVVKRPIIINFTIKLEFKKIAVSDNYYGKYKGDF
jgi:hypothetical protein